MNPVGIWVRRDPGRPAREALLLERGTQRAAASSGSASAPDHALGQALDLAPDMPPASASAAAPEANATAETLRPQSAAEGRVTEGQDVVSAPLSEDIAAGAVVSAELGRAFLLRRPEAWRITAGLFGRTFASAPGLLLRLYAAEDPVNLCRLGRILEKAAPCVGAERLASAAHAMQWAVNDADAASAALAVEECVLALREVLEALEGQTARKESKPSLQEGGR